MKKEPWKERIRVGNSPLGKAVFAKRQIRKGTVVGQIRGEVIDDPKYSSNYGIDLGGHYQLEPAAPFRFLNHSCEPNCELIYTEPEVGDPSKNQLFLQAIATIRLGDELMIDYGWPAHAAIKCGCGTNSCRGWVVSQTELPKILKRQKKKSTAKKPDRNKRRKLAKK